MRLAGAPISFWELTCWVCRNIQDGLQQLHVFNVVNVNGLLQTHQQPLESHTLISLPDWFLERTDQIEITHLSRESYLDSKPREGGIWTTYVQGMFMSAHMHVGTRMSSST